MGFLFGKKLSAAAHKQPFEGISLNKSAYGDVIPVLVGPNRVDMKLIWAGDWKDVVTTAPGQHVGKGLGGGGSTPGQTSHEYSEAIQSLLGFGPCDRIDSFWTSSGRVGVMTVGVNYTVAGGGGFIDIVDANYSGDMGVGGAQAYSQVVNDYGDPRGSRTLSGTYNRSLTRGTVSAPGVYVISHPVSGTTRYTFNAADAGLPVVITYQASLSYVYNSAETPIPASPYQYTVPNTSTFWGPNSATTVTNVNTGAAFTRVSGAPAAGQFSVTGTSGTPGGGVFQFNAADAGTLVLIKWQSQDTTVNPSQASLTFTLENGASGQTPWSYLQSTHPDQAVSYPFMAVWQFAPLQLGSSNSVPQLSAEPVMNQYMAGGGIAGANPATVIKAILTDPVWGIGMDPSLLADWVTPAGSAFNFWQANNFFISLKEDTQTTALDVINRILEAGQAVMFWDQGQLQIAVYGDTSVAGNGVVYQPDTQPVVNFSVDDFVAAGGASPVKAETEPLNHLYNRVKAQWMNALVDYRTEVLTEEDTASINQNGLLEEGQQNWEFIRYVQQAQWAANLRLRRYTNIRDTFTWSVPTRYRHLLKPMKLVTATWAHMGWNNKPLRILKIEEDHNGLALTMEEFPYGVAAAVQYPKLTAQAINTNPALISPGNTDLVAFEVPDQLNNYAGNVIRIYADPVTPNNWGGVNVYYSGDNVNFVPLGQINQSVTMATLGGNGMALAGTRIQTSGGTQTYKYYLGGGPGSTGLDVPSLNGTVYTISCQIKNNGPTNVYMNGNIGPMSAAVAPGATAYVTVSATGNGSSNCQLIFYTQNAGDSMDITVSNPFYSHTGSNQISGGNLTFSQYLGWGVGTSGATLVGVTQLTGTDTQTIQLTDVNSVPLAQPSAFDFTNNNSLLAIVDAGGTFEIVAYQNVTLVGNNLYNVQGFHRGLFGTTQAAHAAGSNVISLGSAFLEVQFAANQVGQTFYFRGASFNKLLGRLQDYTTLGSLSVPLGSSSPGLFTGGALNAGHASLDNIADGGATSRMVNSANMGNVPATNMRGLNLVSNPDFAAGSQAFQVPGGTQNFNVYDNNATGHTTVTPSTGDPHGSYPPYLPNTTGYALKVQTTPGANPTPGFGGFYLSIGPDSGVSQVGAYHKGNTIIWRILAKIPKSCSIQFASNAYGNDGSFQWITTQKGQGDGNNANPGASGPFGYQSYIAKQKIGTFGSFSTTGFFYVFDNATGNNNNPNIIPDSDNVGGTWTPVGGANIFIHQGLFGPTGEWPGTWETTNPAGGVVNTYAQSGIITVVPGQQYIISSFVNCNAITAGAPFMALYDTSVVTQYFSFVFSPGNVGRYSQVWTCPGGVTQVRFLFHTNSSTFTANQFIQMGNPQIEVFTPSSNPNATPSAYMPNPLVWWVAEASAIDIDVPQYTSDGYNLMRQGVSTSLNAQNSIMPGQTVAFTATQSPTSVGYSWGAQTLKRPDNSNLSLAAGSVNFTGLANSTLYYSYPYLTVSGSSAIMNWVQGGAGGGGAFTSGTQTSATAMNAYLDGRFSLGAIHNTTQSAGGTGGGGGGGDPGGSCPSEDELAWVIRGGADPVRMRMGDVRHGDLIKGWSFAEQKDVWRKVEGFRHLPTSMWFKVNGYLCSACETVYLDGAWQQAYKVPGATKVRGVHVQRVEIQVEHNGFTGNEERNYWLDNGTDAPLLMHNFFPYC